MNEFMIATAAGRYDSVLNRNWHVGWNGKWQSEGKLGIGESSEAGAGENIL